MKRLLVIICVAACAVARGVGAGAKPEDPNKTENWTEAEVRQWVVDHTYGNWDTSHVYERTRDLKKVPSKEFYQEEGEVNSIMKGIHRKYDAKADDGTITPRTLFSHDMAVEGVGDDMASKWAFSDKSTDGWTPEPGFAIRQKFSDLPSDDPTAAATTNNPKSQATFSYARDYIQAKDTWTAQGVIMAPIKFEAPDTDEDSSTAKEIQKPEVPRITLEEWGIVPSIAFDHVSSQQSKAQDIDSLDFRIGMYWDLTGGGVDAQQFRVFGTYGSDFELRSQIPAGEFEWEPVWFGVDVKKEMLDTQDKRDAPRLALGTHCYVFPHGLRYLLRGYLHLEGGSIDNTGGKAGVTEGSFVRLGPATSVTFDFPDVSLLKNASLTLGARYYATAIGDSSRDYDVTGGLAYTIDSGKHFSITANYEYGAVDLTTQPVETLTLGLGIWY